jgi:hypothetical protein
MSLFFTLVSAQHIGKRQARHDSCLQLEFSLLE